MSLPGMSLLEVLCWLREELPLTRRQAPKVGHVDTAGEPALRSENYDLLLPTCIAPPTER